MTTIISWCPVGRSRPEMLGDPRKRKRMAEGGPHSRTGPTRESPPSLFLGLLPCPNTGFHGDGMGGGLESFLTCSSRSQRRILECLQPSLPSSTLGDEEPKSCPYQPISPCHPSPHVYLGQSSLLGHLHGLLHFPLSFPSTDLLTTVAPSTWASPLPHQSTFHSPASPFLSTP